VRDDLRLRPKPEPAKHVLAGIGHRLLRHEIWRPTGIPQELHHRLRLYCVTHGVVLIDFVVAAIEEKLDGSEGRRREQPDTRSGLPLRRGPSPTVPVEPDELADSMTDR